MSCCSDSFSSLAKNKITIETCTQTADGYGGFTQSWTTYKTVWAIIQPRSGKESVIHEQLNSRVDSQIIIRYISDLSNTLSGAAYRILFNNRYFNILSVQNFENLPTFNNSTTQLEGKRFQRLICQEGGIA